MKYFASLALSLFCVCGMAQVSQKVQVVEYQGAQPATPLSGVSVSVGNAPSVISDANGSLNLEFRTMHAGDPVQVRRIERNGYEIFNTQAIEQWTISPAQPFRLVLCPSSRIRSMKERYMQLASDNYRRQYRQDSLRLAEDWKQSRLQEEAFQASLKRLDSEFQHQLSMLESYVDHFVRIDLTELTSQQSHLVELVNQGRFDEAIRAYEEADYLGRFNHQSSDIRQIDLDQAALDNARSQQEKQRSALIKSIERQVITYRLAGGSTNFQKAARLLKSVADADTTYLPAVSLYVDDCSQQMNTAEILAYTPIAIRHAEGWDKANMCRFFGLYCQTVYDSENGNKYILLANDMAQKLLQTQGTSMKAKRVMSKLGVAMCRYYHSMGQYQECYDYATSVIPSVQSLYDDAPEVYIEELYFIRGYANCCAYALQRISSDEAFRQMDELNNLIEQNANGDLFRLRLRYECTSQIADFAKEQNDTALCLSLHRQIFKWCTEAYKSNPEGELLYKTMNLVNLYAIYAEFKMWEDALAIEAEMDDFFAKCKSVYGENQAIIDYFSQEMEKWRIVVKER